MITPYDSLCASIMAKAERIGLDITEMSRLLRERGTPEKKEELLEYLRYLPIDSKSLIDYIEMGGLEASVFDTNSEENQAIPPALHGLVHSFFAANDNPGHAGIAKSLKYISKPFATREITQSIRLCFDQSDKNVLLFIISPEITLEGKVIAQLHGTKVSIPLISKATRKTSDGIESYLKFFGEGLHRSNPESDLLVDFWVYQFKSSHQTYTVLSQCELPNQPLLVRGQSIKVIDSVEVGVSAKINSRESIILLHSFDTVIQKLDEVAFLKWATDQTHHTLAETVFGKCRHPIWFEKLFLAVLLSGKFDGYPLHFAWVGPPGTGKSETLECMNKLFDENERVFSGSSSTFKSLVPNFGQKLPQPGYILACQRVALVDEFVVAINKNPRLEVADRGEQAAMLQELLEHKERIASSGRTGSLSVKATAKVFLTSNPGRVYKDMAGIAQSFDQPFLSRILWYHQTKDHVKFVEGNKITVSGIEKADRLAHHNPQFIGAYDFLNSFTLKGDPERVSAIVSNLRLIVPPAYESLFEGRAVHHTYCLLDGLAKYRSIIEKRDKLCIEESDYVETEQIFRDLITSWSGDIIWEHIPEKLRPEYLLGDERTLYEYIEKNLGQMPNFIEAATGIKSVHYKIKAMETKGVIAIIKDESGHKCYPYWHNAAQLVKLEESLNDSN